MLIFIWVISHFHAIQSPILSGALLRHASGLSFEQSCTTSPHHWNFEIFLGCSYLFGIYPIFIPSNHQFCLVSFLDLPLDYHLCKVEWQGYLPYKPAKKAMKAKFILVYLSVPRKCKWVIFFDKPLHWRLQLWLKIAHKVLDYHRCKVECKITRSQATKIDRSK